MKSAKTIAILLALLLSANVISCGSQTSAGKTDTDSDVTTEPESTTEPVDPASVLELPDSNWGGREFRVLGLFNSMYPQFDNFEIFSEGETGDIVNDAVFKRNTAIEDRYGVKITQTLVESPSGEIRKNVTAGDDMYDLVFDTLSEMGSLAQNKFLVDLNGVKHIDFSKNWWNPDVNDTKSVMGRLYRTSSDFSLRDKSSTGILVYNKKLAEDYSIPNLADAVRDGSWTVDKMAGYVKETAADLDGDGEMKPVSDRWGLVMGARSSFPTFVVACENRFITKDKDDSLVLSMNTERISNSIDKVLGLTSDLSNAFFCEDWQGKIDGDFWSAASKTFYAGNSLFATSVPYSLKSYSANCDFDYGILPFPKYDETQGKYYTLPDTTAHLFGIPVSCADPDFTGFMLEALSAGSTDTTLEAYIETSCKTKYSYDKDSAEMFDTAMDGIIFEPSMIYGIGGLYEILRNKITVARKNTFASAYASVEKSAKTALEKLTESFSEAE